MIRQLRAATPACLVLVLCFTSSADATTVTDHHHKGTTTTDPTCQTKGPFGGVAFQCTPEYFVMNYLMAGRCTPKSTAAFGSCQVMFTEIRHSRTRQYGAFFEKTYRLCNFGRKTPTSCLQYQATGSLTAYAFHTPSQQRKAVARRPGVAGWSFGEWLIVVNPASSASTVNDVVDDLWSGDFNNFEYRWGPKPPLPHA